MAENGGAAGKRWKRGVTGEFRDRGINRNGLFFLNSYSK